MVVSPKSGSWRRRALCAVPLAITVLMASAVGAYAAPVSWITDDRVTESSALAVSVADKTIAYTLNDDEPGDAAVVYAIKISTGAVLGETTLTGVRALDPEALAIDANGNLWFADAGVEERDWASEPPTLYKFKEQLRVSGEVTPTAYPITYSTGNHENVEALLIRPKDGAKHLITKGVADNSGKRFSLPSKLKADELNTATLRQSHLADSVSDGSFTPNSKWAVVRKAKTKVYVYDATVSPWKFHYKWDVLNMTALRKPESLGFRPDGKSFLVGSEGEGQYTGGKSPLYLVGFNQSTGKPS